MKFYKNRKFIYKTLIIVFAFQMLSCHTLFKEKWTKQKAPEYFKAKFKTTKGNFEIALPVSQNNVKIEIYNIQSQLISVKNYTINNGKVQLNINSNATGLYFAKVYLEEPIVLKIIKE